MEASHIHCVASYRNLRRLIGWAGLLMPAVVRWGAWFADGVPATDSLSAYYYTSMRDIFVATTVLTGALLMCYRTGEWQDTAVASLAGLAAIGLALFPMDPTYAAEVLARYPDLGTERHYSNHGVLGFHLVFALSFAALSFYLVFFRFAGEAEKHGARGRKLAYRICGGVMLLSYLSMLLLAAFAEDASFFWPETCAVTALALAWLVKGEAPLPSAPGRLPDVSQPDRRKVRVGFAN